MIKLTTVPATIILYFVFFIFYSSCTNKEQTEPDTISITIHKTNPGTQGFPGGRGANELVCYTPEFGDSTGTNKYGIEAIIVNETVQSVGRNNNPIPSDGFVLSGHGSMSKWISDHLHPGLRVALKDSTISVTRTAETDLVYAEYFLKRANERLENLDSADLPEKETLHLKINELSDKTKSMRRSAASGQEKQAILDEARVTFYRTFPSNPDEVRAVWYHLREKTPQELEKTFKDMAALGINTLCPETIYGGYAIYPDAHPDLVQHPQFTGWDPMEEMLRLGKIYNIRIVPWVWVFFIGKENSPLVQIKADQLALSRAGEHASELEKGYHFLCPARSEVHRFWLDVYTTMLKRYDIGGLQLDYIRYPVGLPWEKSFCYCDHCRSTFKAQMGLDPMEIDPDTHPEAWEKWYAFRTANVTMFVGKVHERIETINPNVPLSADVFPNVQSSIESKCQDWGTWLEKGYLDEIFTMSYSPDVETVRNEARYLAARTSEGQPGYVGLGPYQGFRPEILLEEIYQVQQSGVQGFCLFEYGSLRQPHLEALKAGPLRN